MKRIKDADDHRYSELYRAHRDFKIKSRTAMAKALLDAANYKRREMRQINPKFGYFKENGKVFVEG